MFSAGLSDERKLKVEAGLRDPKEMADVCDEW
jgi:hypothetical protein